MAWVAVDKDGKEIISPVKPERNCQDMYWMCLDSVSYEVFTEEPQYEDFGVVLPKGSIKKLIGRELSWEDNPVELKEDE